MLHTLGQYRTRRRKCGGIAPLSTGLRVARPYQIAERSTARRVGDSLGQYQTARRASIDQYQTMHTECVGP
eukprot:86610-Rhodomonas_salina.3